MGGCKVEEAWGARSLGDDLTQTKKRRARRLGEGSSYRSIDEPKDAGGKSYYRSISRIPLEPKISIDTCGQRL